MLDLEQSSLQQLLHVKRVCDIDRFVADNLKG